VAAFGLPAQAAERGGLKKDSLTFGTLQAPTEAAVRVQAAGWLKEVGKYDSQRQAFDALWEQKDKSLLERVAGTFQLGDAAAARLLAEAKNPLSAAPTTLPALLQDTKKPVFFRANLALAYSTPSSPARCTRKVWRR